MLLIVGLLNFFLPPYLKFPTAIILIMALGMFGGSILMTKLMKKGIAQQIKEFQQFSVTLTEQGIERRNKGAVEFFPTLIYANWLSTASEMEPSAT
ncbi:MAG: hypothetical protein IPL28_12795 [Chloroflexi bacterium]|nr:hypothetical protein [Chloroflexota bacterium]